MPRRSHLFIFALVAAALLAAPPLTLAQRAVPLAPNGNPRAPDGLQGRKLGDGPFAFRTAEGMDIRVSVLARLESPYALVELPDGEMLVTTRTGTLRRLLGGRLLPEPVRGGPVALRPGEPTGGGARTGYMRLALHPRFAENRLLYLAYTRPLVDGKPTVAVARARYHDGSLSELRDVWVGEGRGGAVSVLVSEDAKLWIGLADYDGKSAQDPASWGGKVLRLTDDGSVPADNPFVGQPPWRPEVWTFGHRSPMALAQHPVTREIYVAEMGPNGGDEINRLARGRNYGWPIVSLGRAYPGPWAAEGQRPTHEGYEPPIVYWMPAISVASLAFYTGDALPKWKGDLLVGGFSYGEIPGTGRLDRVLLNERMEELRRESLLVPLGQRIHDVVQGRDGLLYLTTDEKDGAILRIEPQR